MSSTTGETFLESLQRLHTHLWGQNIINVFKEGGKSYSTIDLKFFPLTQNTSARNVLLIRDEYRLAYETILEDTLKKTDRRKSAFLVSGQAGIGKTLFSLYLLVRRLQERQPVAFQINADQFALFDEHGVALHPASSSNPFKIPMGAWAISDADLEAFELCRDFRFQRAHVIYISSPASRRWKEWDKQSSAIQYIMDVWSLDEIRTLLTINNLNIEHGVALFRKYGPFPRIIIDILLSPILEVKYLEQVNSGAAHIASEFSTVLRDLRNLDFSSNLSSKIIAVKPDLSRSRLPVLFIPTQFLLSTLGIAVSRQAAAQKQSFFIMFSYHPSLRSSAGWLFEHYAHVFFSSPNRISVDGHLRDDPNPHPIPISREMITGSTALGAIQPPFNFYWRPLEPNFSGVDAIIRSDNVVWALQFTISASHRSATKGLDKLYELMNHKTGVEWHLVIVGPDLTKAKSARDHQKLTGDWTEIPVYACELLPNTFTEDEVQQLEANLNEDEMYPMDQRVDSDVQMA